LAGDKAVEVTVNDKPIKQRPNQKERRFEDIKKIVMGKMIG